MTSTLVFTLAAPVASFGAVAAGERRPSWDRPSKSQVLGLVAGALGIERGEEERHLALARGFLFAVRVDAPGQPQSDYHTAQVPPAKKNRRFATRAGELAIDKTDLKTILSRREFRTGAISTIALWHAADAEGVPSLEDLQKALREPVFTPFAGRKANALMLPMAPRVVSGDDVTVAFAEYDRTAPEDEVAFRAAHLLHRDRATPRVYAEAGAVPSQLRDRIEQRRDVPESRSKWRFGLRAEALLKPTTTGGAT